MNANFNALNHCQIKLSFLLDDELEGIDDKDKKHIQDNIEGLWADESIEKGYKYFMATYESTIVAIVEKGSHRD